MNTRSTEALDSPGALLVLLALGLLALATRGVPVQPPQSNSNGMVSALASSGVYVLQLIAFNTNPTATSGQGLLLLD